MTHTPGPWIVDTEPYEVLSYESNDRWIVRGPDGLQHVASVYFDQPGDVAPTDEDASNARLIAAAPDLLSAAEELIDQLEGIGIVSDDPTIDEGLWHGAEGLTTARVRAAIAAAKGETP